jgi:hypothetical protein
MAETPLQTLLRYMGQEQARFLPQQQMPVGEELRQRFMQNLARQPTTPPLMQNQAMPPAGLPLPPSPREAARQQLERLKARATGQVLGTLGTESREDPAAAANAMVQARAQQGVSTLAAPPSGGERFMGFLRNTVRPTFENIVDPETGMPNVDVAAAPIGAASRLFGKAVGKLPPEAQTTVQNAWRTWRTKITEDLTPIRDITTGLSLPPKENPYYGATLFGGYHGKTELYLRDFKDIVQPFSKGLNPLKWREQNSFKAMLEEYARIDRHREQAMFGIDKFPGGMTSLDLINRHKQLEAMMTPEQLQTIKATQPRLTELHNKVLLNAADSGLVSKKTAQNLISKYHRYVPLQVMAEDLEAMQRTGISGSLQVTKPDVVRHMTGGTNKVEDVFESMVRDIYRVTNQAERNRVAVQIANLEQHIPQTVFELKPGQMVPNEFGKLTAYRDGVPHEYAIPAPLADAVKGMNSEQADLVTQWARKSTAILRGGAVTFNAAFIPTNLWRDLTTSKVVARGFGSKFTMADWVNGFASAIKQDKKWENFLESGASFAGYNLAHRKVSVQASKLFRTKNLDRAMTVVNPFQLINKTGSIIESAPRIGIQQRLIKSGVDPVEAAFRAVNLTVNFRKAGTVTRLMNQWVPFLTARMQGTVNIGEALFNSKNPAAAWTTAAGIVGIPAVATYYWNTRMYPDIYRDIQNFEDDNNFMIIHGRGMDSRGNPTDVIKLPKGDLGRILGNPLQAFLRYLDGADPYTSNAIALQMLSDISPVDFAREGELSGTALLSGITPPTLKAGIETVSGVNMFTGRAIEPIGWVLDGRSPKEMYYGPKYAFDENGNRVLVDPGTPTWAVAFSEVLADHNIKISPLRILNAIGTQFGGLGRQLSDPEMAPRMFSQRFFGARGGEIMRRELEHAKDINTQIADIAARHERIDEQNWMDFRDQRMSPERRERAIKDFVATNEFSGILRKALMEHKNPLEKYLLSVGPKVRAQYISDYMERLPPEAAGYLDSKWTALGILNIDTRLELSNLTQQKAKVIQ